MALIPGKKYLREKLHYVVIPHSICHCNTMSGFMRLCISFPFPLGLAFASWIALTPKEKLIIWVWWKALGESGIVLSKLSNSLETSTSGSPRCQENSVFLPERYLPHVWKMMVFYCLFYNCYVNLICLLLWS